MNLTMGVSRGTVPGAIEVGCSGKFFLPPFSCKITELESSLVTASLDSTSTANAVIMLEAWAWCNDGDFVPGGTHAYALVNGIQAYGCSYGGNLSPCSSTEYSWAQQAWEAECGTRWGTGYVYIPVYAKTYGQGVYQPGGACSNGVGSEFRVH
jgi:hypothetical protein